MTSNPLIYWCDACQNTGWTEFFCGGELCICTNYGARECDECQGGELLADRYVDGMDVEDERA